ncbi:hypothetical protein BP6252_02715 [Coleophoma cylindrospora]|uniref:alpha-L-rhamnosidase n=1 Tax=Coleophoma cylindrospora TaxID=1849047 RepID=A0A3D8SFK7_9HELO|nr:hypothetical protein BP6252_02715 [Coleophoma cylindrospora]
MSSGVPTIAAPTFEQHHDGFGIGNACPRLSWRFTSIAKDWKQSGYDLEVRRKDGKTESYHVEGSQSVLAPWPSQPLESREQASVRVRSFQDGSEVIATEWSDWAVVEAGLLNKEDWTAEIISAAATAHDDGPLRPVRLRKTFTIPPKRDIQKSRLYITCLGIYEAYINGVRVGDHVMAPGWTSYHHRLNYQTFDVAPLLREGENVISVEIAEGWYATRLLWKEGRRYTYGKDLALLSQLEISFGDDDKIMTIPSDTTWKRHDSAILRSELYDGEVYDMREETEDWHSPGSTGATQNDAVDSWTNVTFATFPQKTQLVASDAPPVRVIEEVAPVNIFKSPAGKTLIDFGQNLVGRVHVTSLKKPAGHKVTFQHAEVLENGELGIRPLRCAKALNTVISSGAELKDWYPHFTFQGFRYMQVDGWSPEDESDPLTEDKIKVQLLHTDLKRTGWFSCSNEKVNKLHNNALWSMRGNFLSIPTDCPQRDERLGWTGDIQVFGPSAGFLYNTTGMLGNWLEDLSVDQEDANSIPPVIIPNVLKDDWKDTPQAAWCDVTVLLPWTLYKSSQDAEILRRQYPSMVSWLKKGLPRGSDGLWESNHWKLGDWLDPAAPPEAPDRCLTDATLVADAYLVYVTGIVSEICTIIGLADDHKMWAADYAKVKETFQRKYITPSGLVMSDTQTAYALALVFSLYENKSQVSYAAQRLARLVKIAAFRVSCGFVGTPLITHALSRTANPDLAYRMLLEEGCPSWLYPVSMGATTMWERWDSMLPDGTINPGSMTSFNHYALGSVVNWLHEVVAGISPLEPGWKKILVRPVPGGDLTTAEAKFESPYGEVKSSWVAKSGVFMLSLVIPPNSTAWVVMPDKQSTDAGSVEEEKGFEIGSGKHDFMCKWENVGWPPKALYVGWPGLNPDSAA